MEYGRKNPYPATIKEAYCLARDNVKETNHYIVDIADSGLEYKPGDSLGLRANYARAVRSPTLSNLFAPPTENFLFLDDPCDADNIQMSGPCFTDVNFYGAMYDHCYVGSNGDVTFTAGSSDFTQTYGEWASSMPRIGWAADLQPNVYGTVTFNGLSAGFRVDYTDMSEWGTGGLGVISYAVEVSASAGASITGMTEDGTWGGTTQCLGASNGSLGTDPGQADFAALFAGGGAGAGAATDMWVDAAAGMISGAGSTYSNILFPAADGSSIAIN